MAQIHLKPALWKPDTQLYLFFLQETDNMAQAILTHCCLFHYFLL